MSTFSHFGPSFPPAFCFELPPAVSPSPCHTITHLRSDFAFFRICAGKERNPYRLSISICLASVWVRHTHMLIICISRPYTYVLYLHILYICGSCTLAVSTLLVCIISRPCSLFGLRTSRDKTYENRIYFQKWQQPRHPPPPRPGF